MQKSHIERLTVDGERTAFEISSDFGYVETLYTEDGIYQISNFEVDVPRQGYGRDLLKTSREHAIELGAKVILAVIISREAYESARIVFGDGSLKVYELGTFKSYEGTALPTSVFMEHSLT